MRGNNGKDNALPQTSNNSDKRRNNGGQEVERLQKRHCGGGSNG
jgi:hypothetical protein